MPRRPSFNGRPRRGVTGWAACRCAVLALAVSGLASAAAPAGRPAGSSASDWPAVGNGYDELHYSPLKSIDEADVGRLKLAWYFDIPGIVTTVSTPLEVRGTLYFVVGQGLVRALDAGTGQLKWDYDPKATTAPDANLKLRVSWGVRGIAFGDDKIFVGTVDGRLIAVDAGTGRERWSAKTTEPGDGRFLSGPPRFFNGRVIIGHGGGDSSYSRGYVTSYDAASGRRLWRFYTVPGDPSHGFESPALEAAAATWSGQWWKYGGGGTVWNAISFDAELDRIYIGTGNGVPWNPRIRSPGGGDNLFTCSIVALDARTGRYLWHYQVSPGDAWDFDATQDMELATLRIGGAARKVLMQASKNGFFYVIDRTSGKLLAAEKYGRETWAVRVDLATGRPVESPNARYLKGAVDVWPDPNGEHNWHAMSFNPHTGLAYIPSFAAGVRLDDSRVDVQHWREPPPGEGRFGVDASPHPDAPSSRLIAWDPVRGTAAWSVSLEPGIHGGTLTTAGNLVFQGRADGAFFAYAADTGKPLWSFDAQVGIVGAPITYALGSRQYISVIAGYNGFAGVLGGLGASHGWDARTQRRRVLTFALDASGSLPPPDPKSTPVMVRDPAYAADAERAAAGAVFYMQRCYICHGFGARAGGQAPDLRSSNLILTPQGFSAVVKGGALQSAGMPGFADAADSEIEAIRQYLRERAAEGRNPASAP